MIKAKTVEKENTQLDDLIGQHSQPVPKVGDVVEGTVLAASKQEVLIDIDGVGVGVVRGNEVYDESGEYANPDIGVRVSATILDLDNERGELELSFRFAGHQKAWGNLRELANNAEVVIAKITEANKGGLMVKVGNVSGFLPVSQLSPEHYPRVEGGDKSRILLALKEFIGQELPVRILDVNEDDNKLIVSEKSAVEEQRRSALSGYEVGQTIEGKISGIVDFGVFVEFGDGLEGLAHISELAWRRLDHPKELFMVGQTVKAKIIGLDGTRISLSLRALQDDPWSQVAEKYQVGQVVEGTVLKLNPFGAFVELDEQIHGLCHISEIDIPTDGKVEDILKIGEKSKFKIISLEPQYHRLGLSAKDLNNTKTVEENEPVVKTRGRKRKTETIDPSNA